MSEESEELKPPLNLEVSLVAMYSTRTFIKAYKRFIYKCSLNPLTFSLLKSIETWFTTFEKQDTIDWEEFYSWLKVTQFHKYSKEDFFILDSLIIKMINGDYDTGTAKEILTSLASKKVLEDVVDIALEGLNGTGHGLDKSLLEVKETMSSFTQDQAASFDLDSTLVTNNFQELFIESYGKDGLIYRLPELRYALGKLRPGNSIILAGYTDNGKTTLALSETSHLVQQLPEDKEFIYFCNEESGGGVKIRFIQATIGWPIEKIMEDLSAAEAEYSKIVRGAERIKFFWNTSMTTDYVERVLARSNPGLVVFDQLFNISISGDSQTSIEARITTLAKWVRTIAQGVPCISLHQADGTSHGCKYIQLDQLYYSKVGLPGAADAIITVGRSVEDGVNPNERGIYIPKNKLAGSIGTDKKCRNSKFDVYINEDLARFDSAKSVL